MFLGHCCMRFTSDFCLKNQDASDVMAGNLDGMVTDSFVEN